MERPALAAINKHRTKKCTLPEDSGRLTSKVQSRMASQLLFVTHASNCPQQGREKRPSYIARVQKLSCKLVAILNFPACLVTGRNDWLVAVTWMAQHSIPSPSPNGNPDT